MSKSGPKQKIFGSLAKIAQAISHPHRIEILEHLGQGERSVEDLAALLDISIANMSRHLQILRRVHIAEPTRSGKRMLYRLTNLPDIVGLTLALGRIGERNIAEMQMVITNYYQRRDSMAPLTRSELLAGMRDNTITLLDVRPEDEFSAGHLPGALNIPLPVLMSRIGGLPSDKQIVAYCRGPYCVLSVEAAARLRELGFNARRLDEGFPEWKAAGQSIEVTH